MKGIIIYKSKYGAARKYAGWLNEATGYEAVSVEKADVNTLSDYDVIILGGGVYAHGIAIVPFLKKNLSSMNGKKVIAFCCGASPYEESYFKEMKDYNMKDQLADIPLFYCRGACSMDGMSFKDKTLCKMLRKSLEKKDPKDYAVWEAALVEAVDTGKDWTDKEYIKPIIEECGK